MRIKRVQDTDNFEIWDSIVIGKDFDGNDIIQERPILVTSLVDAQKRIDNATAEKVKWTRIKNFIEANS